VLAGERQSHEHAAPIAGVELVERIDGAGHQVGDFPAAPLPALHDGEGIPAGPPLEVTTVLPEALTTSQKGPAAGRVLLSQRGDDAAAGKKSTRRAAGGRAYAGRDGVGLCGDGEAKRQKRQTAKRQDGGHFSIIIAETGTASSWIPDGEECHGATPISKLLEEALYH